MSNNEAKQCQHYVVAEYMRIDSFHEFACTACGELLALRPVRRLNALEAQAALVPKLVAALDTVTSALLWASGCFQTEAEFLAWARTGRPAVDVGLAALREARGEPAEIKE